MAQFKTAYLQRMVPVDAVVVGSVTEGTAVTSANRKAAICRNDFVIYTPATSTVPASITKATQAQVTAKQATHIVALTDMTISDGHVPTDLKDYRPSELVGATKTTAAAAGDEGLVKKVGLYPIWDWADIVQDADQNDAAQGT